MIVNFIRIQVLLISLLLGGVCYGMQRHRDVEAAADLCPGQSARCRLCHTDIVDSKECFCSKNCPSDHVFHKRCLRNSVIRDELDECPLCDQRFMYGEQAEIRGIPLNIKQRISQKYGISEKTLIGAQFGLIILTCMCGLMTGSKPVEVCSLCCSLAAIVDDSCYNASYFCGSLHE